MDVDVGLRWWKFGFRLGRSIVAERTSLLAGVFDRRLDSEASAESLGCKGLMRSVEV